MIDKPEADHARFQALESALAAMREERDEMTRKRDTMSGYYEQAVKKVAHVTEERDHWKRRAEDAEGRIGDALA